MAIHAPGKRDRRHKRIKPGGRKLVASLSLTAMVDMFTVLTIFLLQNYSVDNFLVTTPKDIHLPKAASIKELAPAHVVTVSESDLLLDDVRVADASVVKTGKDWMIVELYRVLKPIFDEENKKRAGLRDALQQVVRGQTDQELKKDQLGKITIQADKNVDFLTIKKLMYTVTEAGAIEINFAVTKKKEEQKGS